MKILYIDDQGTDSLKLDLEKYGFDVETSDAGEFNSTLAKINEDFVGDVYFPEIKEEEWKEISKEKGLKNDENPYDYEYITYVRK